MQNRREVRSGLKVIHRHRAGHDVSRRVSELVLIKGVAKAILGWIDLGGVRTPIYLCDLDRAKLTRSKRAKNTYYYSGTTTDPRYVNVEPAWTKRPGANR